MDKRKSLIYLVALVALMGAIFYIAYEHGQKRYDYTVEPIGRFLPIPILHEQYSATAVWKGELQIRASWAHTLGPPRKEGDYFICKGKVKGDAKHVYYLLEHNGKLYLEKDELVEPLIHALCALSRGGPEDNHPKEVADSLDCLPDDEDFVIGLVTFFNTPKSMRK